MPDDYVPLLDGDYSYLPDDFFDDDFFYLTHSRSEHCQKCGKGGKKHNGIWVHEDTGKKLCEECTVQDPEFETQIVRSNSYGI